MKNALKRTRKKFLLSGSQHCRIRLDCKNAKGECVTKVFLKLKTFLIKIY